MRSIAQRVFWDQQIPLAAGALLALFGFVLGYHAGGTALQLNPFASEHPAETPLAKLLIWSLALAIGCGCRQPVAALLARRASPLVLLALAFIPVIAADMLASRFAVGISGYPTCAPGAVPLPTYAHFLPRGAILGTAVLLAMLAWGKHLARRAAAEAANLEPIIACPEPAAPALDGEWLDLAEAPLLRLRIADIVLVRSAGNYSEIVAHGRAHMVRITLTDLAHRLAPLGFVRVHRQTVVNSRQVRQIRKTQGGRGTIQLLCGVSVPLGRSYAKVVLAPPSSTNSS
ncbi:LytTR family DNA-binding domain-containing protein [Sphingomonas sp. CJ20]